MLVKKQTAAALFAHAQDPLALVPWMQAFFALADAGLTTFDISGPFYPHTDLRTLFRGADTAWLYEGVEKLLGVFKRRCTDGLAVL
jgi:hypothetical protein